MKRTLLTGEIGYCTREADAKQRINIASVALIFRGVLHMSAEMC